MRHAFAACLFAIALGLPGTSPALHAQMPPITVNVVLKTNVVRVRSIHDVQLQIRLRDADGHLRAKAERTLHAAEGFVDIALRTPSGFPANIHPGDQVLVLPQGEDPIAIGTVNLDARPVAEADRLLITGPPNAELVVQVNALDNPLPQYFSVTTDAVGAAVLNLAGDVALVPGVSGFVAYEPTPGRAVVVAFHVPTAAVKVGGDWIEGFVWAEREVTLRVEDATGQPIATTRLRSDGEGYFNVRLGEAFANLHIQPGQTVRIAWEDQALVLPVPPLSIHADPATERITGSAPPNASLQITVYDQETRRRRWYWAAADANGRYELNLAGRLDLNPDDEGAAVYITPEGHKFVAEFHLPFVQLEVGSPRVNGRAMEGAVVTATLRSAAGVVKASGSTTANRQGDFHLRLEAAGASVPTAPGDRLELTVENETIVLEVPTLSVQLDAEGERVVGTGPPGRSLTLVLNTDDGQFTQEVVPDATDAFVWDLRDRTDIRPGSTVLARLYTAGGHLVTARAALLRGVLQVGGNRVEGTADPEAPVTVRLYAPDGRLKDRASTTADDQGRFAVALQADCRTPVAIEPGDRGTLQAGGQTVTLEAPPLTAALDPTADTVSGMAPPGAALRIEVFSAQGYRQQELVAGDDGRYATHLDIDVGPGDAALVHYAAPSGHRAFARANVPALRALLGDTVLRGTVQPLETVQIRLLREAGGGPKPIAHATATGDRNGSFAVRLRDDSGQPVAIRARDVVEVQTANMTYRFPVPPLAVAMVPDPPQVVGSTFPDAEVALLGVSQSGGILQTSLRADPDGRFVLPLEPDVALRGGDWVRATVMTAEGFQATVWDAIPQIDAWVGSNLTTVHLTPGVSVTVALRSADDHQRATASGTTDPATGAFEAAFTTPDGTPVAVRPGDRVVLEKGGEGVVAALTVPSLTLRLDAGTGVVEGEAPPGSEVSLEVAGTGGEGRWDRQVPVWSDGSFRARFAGWEPGPGAWARVGWADPETGHRVFRTAYRGWMSALLGGDRVEVRAEPLSQVTLTLRTADGEVKGVGGPMQVDGHGKATLRVHGTDDAPVIIEPGERLELVASDGTTALVVPAVELGIDAAGARAFGRVPEPGTVRVELLSGSCVYERTLQPDATGRFSADFAADTAIRPGDVVHLSYTTRSGHRIEAERQVHGVYLALVTRSSR